MAYLLSGCDGSPKGVIGDAAQAIESGQLSEFQRTLTPEAKKTLGTQETLARLRVILASVDQDRSSSYEQLSSTQTSCVWNSRCLSASLDAYGLSVFTKSDASVESLPVLKIEILCQVETNPGMKEGSQSTIQECKISGIRFVN